MRKPLLALAVLPLLAGCGGKKGGGNANETGRVTVDLITPPAGSPDPFQGLASTHVTVREGGTIVFEDNFGAGVPITVLGLTPGTGRTVELQGLDSGSNVVSHGITLPFDFVEGQSITVPLYFSRSRSFNAVHGTAVPRVGAASAAFPDGAVLIAGGLSGSSGIASAQLYDPLTDTLSNAGTMSTAHAFTQAVLLSTNAILVTGGATTASGATAKADVFVRNGATGSWAASVPPMSTARRDLAAARLTGGEALVAGGDPGTGFPLDTTEVFTWTGSAGTWAAGDPMTAVRMGAFALPVEDGTVLVGGGYNNHTEGGPSFFSKTTDIYAANGAGATQSAGNALSYSEGYAGIVPLDASNWLIIGGEVDIASPLFTAKTQLVHWTGSGLSVSSKADLPSAHRRGGGGVAGDGSVVVEGGDTGTRPFVTAVDESLLYDPNGDAFSTLAATPGATSTFSMYPLPDGTSLVVSDTGVFRFNY